MISFSISNSRSTERDGTGVRERKQRVGNSYTIKYLIYHFLPAIHSLHVTGGDKSDGKT